MSFLFWDDLSFFQFTIIIIGIFISAKLIGFIGRKILAIIGMNINVSKEKLTEVVDDLERSNNSPKKEDSEKYSELRAKIDSGQIRNLRMLENVMKQKDEG